MIIIKVIIIGGVAGGATTATRLRRLDEKAEIIILERGSFVSFANCGLPYYIGDVIKEKQELLLQTPESFKTRFNIDVRVRTEAIKIDRKNKKVLIKDLNKNEEYKENYDKLVLSPGGKPINPFVGIEDDKILTLRNVDDSVKIKEYIEENKPKNVCIIGGGYIGVEMAENIKMYPNINVSIIEKASHLITPLDTDMAGFVHKTLIKNGVNLYLKNGVKNIKYDNEFYIELEKGEVKADLIILCIGIGPETKLAEEAGLELTDRKHIVVDKSMRTSDDDIYALGDVVQVTNFVTKKPVSISLAGPANRQARTVANNIAGRKCVYEGVIGSSILKVFDNTLAVTGINETTCIAQNIPYKKMIITPYSNAPYYPGAVHINSKSNI